MGIREYPTLRLFTKPGEWIQYQGPRTLDSFVSFVTSKVREVFGVFL